MLWESASFDKGKTDIDMTGEFEARTTNTRAWTSGDTITEADEEDVAQLVSQLYDFLTSETTQATIASAMDKMLTGRNLKKHQKPLEFSIIDTNRIKAIFGTKVVLLYADPLMFDANLLSSTPIEDSKGRTISFEMRYAYFFRKDGEWIMIESP